MYLAGTWDPLTTGQSKRLAAAVDRPLRKADGAHRPPREGGRRRANAEVRNALRVPGLRPERARGGRAPALRGAPLAVGPG
eukprot:6255589-Lingulodinium_polyedra.AAC.1